ncbi:MAG: CerR family C-terminal domain-containing protein [Planctomycetes bacterium]|nr:CerR family C-terminal domain-containing protein [Planctomycetota bacterium]
MAMRKDGCDTRGRLLEAASRVFADKGYRGTTIAQVCKAARANVAAVNYHFGSKDGLYAKVWRNAFDKSLEMYPLDGGLCANTLAEERLRALIQSHVHRVLDQGALGEAGQILLMEMANPTEAIQDEFVEAVGPLVNHTYGIIRELVGPEASEAKIHFCAMSVVHQCFAFSHRRCKHANHPFAVSVANMGDLVGQLADHIYEFSLAGIAGIRANLSSKADG